MGAVIVDSRTVFCVSDEYGQDIAVRLEVVETG